MKSPIIEALLEGARILFFVVLALVVVVAIDIVAKRFGYDITLERVVYLVGILATVGKMLDKGTFIANKNTAEETGSDTPKGGIAPF